MKKQLIILGLMSLVVLVITMASCKKDNDKTASDYLKAGSWMQTAWTISPGIDFGGGVIITDLFNYFFTEACDKDDLVRFNSDGTITEDQGAIKCDPSDPQTSDGGTWTLSADNQILTVITPDSTSYDTINFTVNTLNGSTLILILTETDDWGTGPVSYTNTMTFTLQ